MRDESRDGMWVERVIVPLENAFPLNALSTSRITQPSASPRPNGFACHWVGWGFEWVVVAFGTRYLYVQGLMAVGTRRVREGCCRGRSGSGIATRCTRKESGQARAMEEVSRVKIVAATGNIA